MNLDAASQSPKNTDLYQNQNQIEQDRSDTPEEKQHVKDQPSVVQARGHRFNSKSRNPNRQGAGVLDFKNLNESLANLNESPPPGNCNSLHVTREHEADEKTNEVSTQILSKSGEKILPNSRERKDSSFGSIKPTKTNQEKKPALSSSLGRNRLDSSSSNIEIVNRARNDSTLKQGVGITVSPRHNSTSKKEPEPAITISTTTTATTTTTTTTTNSSAASQKMRSSSNATSIQQSTDENRPLEFLKNLATTKGKSKEMLSEIAKSETEKSGEKLYTSEKLQSQSKECIKMLKEPELNENERIELRTLAHVLGEKAARQKIAKGEVGEALSIRSKLIEELGPPPLNAELASGLDKTNTAFFGHNLKNTSCRTNSEGTINIDQRKLVSENKDPRPITNITTTVNFPVRKNIDALISTNNNPKIEKAIENLLPKEYKGKVTVSADKHLIFPNVKDRANKHYIEPSEANIYKDALDIEWGKREERLKSPDGLVLGKVWSVEIEGMGKLSIPIKDNDNLYTCKPFVGKPKEKIQEEESILESTFKAMKGILSKSKPEPEPINPDFRIPINTTVLHDLYIEMDGNLSAEEQLKYSQILLSMVGAGPVFETDTNEDHMKMQLLDIYRTFYFQDATNLELQEDIYNYSLKDLQSLIINKVNQQEISLAKAECIRCLYLSGNETEEITTVDGRPSLKITNHSQVIHESIAANHNKGIAEAEKNLEARVEAAKERGATAEEIEQIETNGAARLASAENNFTPFYGFVSGSGGNNIDDDGNPMLSNENIHTTYLVLKSGLLSSLMRAKLGIVLKGDTPTLDGAHGGMDKGFCRGINQNLAEAKKSSDFPISGSVQFYMRSNAVNSDTKIHANDSDSYASYDPDNQTGIHTGRIPLTSVSKFFDSPKLDVTNEFLFSKVIEAQHFVGISVSTEKYKDWMINGGIHIDKNTGKEIKITGLIEHFKKDDPNFDGTFNGIPLDKFIFVVGKDEHYGPQCWNPDLR